MTYCYGATLRGTSQFVEEYVNTEMQVQWPDGAMSGKYSMYAAKKLFQGIAAAVPAAEAAMQWLRSIARQMPNGKRMQWKTPSGFLVQHDYRAAFEKRVALKSCGMNMVVVSEDTDDTVPHSMQNAIAPNFVHALDATHLTLTALRMRDSECSMVGIHDSFGTHMCDVPTMHTHIREAFVQMYKTNVLAEFLWDVGAMGEVPTRGSFDLQNVLNSEFFFC